jgi:hypothetical protein
MTEIWREAFGFEGMYSVSNMGRVRSEPRLVATRSGGFKRMPGRVLKQMTDPKGYSRVSFYRGEWPNKRERFTPSVHRTIARVFLDDFTDDLQVNHKNSDKSDNRLENLEMVSIAENALHASRAGVKAIKLTPLKVVWMRKLSETGEFTFTELGEKFDVSKQTAARVCQRKIWRHVA